MVKRSILCLFLLLFAFSGCSSIVNLKSSRNSSAKPRSVKDSRVKVDRKAPEESKDEQQVFFVVEDMPKFQGKSSNAFRTYIHKNLNYPAIAQENGVSGRVFVQFDITKQGYVTNVTVVRGVDPSLDKEAVRVIKSSPRWTPGKQRGKPVKVRFTFPIAFQLQ